MDRTISIVIPHQINGGALDMKLLKKNIGTWFKNLGVKARFYLNMPEPKPKTKPKDKGQKVVMHEYKPVAVSKPSEVPAYEPPREVGNYIEVQRRAVETDAKPLRENPWETQRIMHERRDPNYRPSWTKPHGSDAFRRRNHLYEQTFLPPLEGDFELLQVNDGTGLKRRSKLVKGSAEAKEWGKKMRAARLAKKHC